MSHSGRSAQIGRTVLVTGGAGYIGSHAVLAMLEAGYSVVVVDNLSSGHPELLPDDVTLVIGNAGDQSLIENIFSNHQPIAVLHFAGSIDASESVSNPEKYYRNNFEVTRSLIAACVKAKVNNFVFSSTATVYGDQGGVLLSEDLELTAINPYGDSKLMVEKLLAETSQNSEFRYIALRFFNVAGADPQGRSGQISEKTTHLIKVICEVVTGKRDKMLVYGNDYNTQDGTCVRDYVHVSDIANAHVLAISHLIKYKKNETLNCGYGKGYSVLEVLKAAEKVIGQNLSVEVAPRRPGDAEYLIADNKKIIKTLGWQPKYDSIEKIIRTAIAWEKKIFDKSGGNISL